MAFGLFTKKKGPSLNPQIQNQMFTCSKIYSDLPFAHRQHNHKGHCSFIHGHNWGFKFVFGAKLINSTLVLDMDQLTEHSANGFVVDFGDLKWLKEWLNSMFDHTLVLNQADPHLDYLVAHLSKDEAFPTFADIRIVPNAGAEGLAHFVYEQVSSLLFARTGDSVFLVSVEVMEDSKNAAIYAPMMSLCRHE